MHIFHNLQLYLEKLIHPIMNGFQSWISLKLVSLSKSKTYKDSDASFQVWTHKIAAENFKKVLEF